MAGAVAFVVKGYPRLSETFIAQEILALERRGLDIRIVSLRHPTEDKRHPIHAAIAAPVLYLPEYLRDAPARVLTAWRAGDREAGEALFERHYASVERFFLNKVRQGVNDLIQSTFLACVTIWLLSIAALDGPRLIRN